jgi:hypothetical protein
MWVNMAMAMAMFVEELSFDIALQLSTGTRW